MRLGMRPEGPHLRRDAFRLPADQIPGPGPGKLTATNRGDSLKVWAFLPEVENDPACFITGSKSQKSLWERVKGKGHLRLPHM